MSIIQLVVSALRQLAALFKSINVSEILGDRWLNKDVNLWSMFITLAISGSLVSIFKRSTDIEDD